MPRNFKRKPEFDPLSVSEKKTFLLKKQTSRLSLRQVAVKDYPSPLFIGY